MSKKLNKVCVCGHFAFGDNLLNGQTVKTKIITSQLEQKLSEDEVVKLDTHGTKKLIALPFMLCSKLSRCRNIIIFPAQNGLRIIAPLLNLLNKLFHRKLHYVVIGGWLPDFLIGKKHLTKVLKKFDYIYVETFAMQNALNHMGFENVCVMPNCKPLTVLSPDNLVYNEKLPFKLCTFSRVMKEKGIEDAIEAVKIANKSLGRTVYTLDIYGQVDSSQVEWFDQIQKSFPDFIRYCGIVDFEKSVTTVKEYHALLFPTYYDGEGFAGTLIDAMASGVPVVASDWKYNSEIVKAGVTGYIYSAKNVEELARILQSDVYSFEKIKAMKENCLTEAEKYQPDKVVDILFEKLDG